MLFCEACRDAKSSGNRFCDSCQRVIHNRIYRKDRPTDRYTLGERVRIAAEARSFVWSNRFVEERLTCSIGVGTAAGMNNSKKARKCGWCGSFEDDPRLLLGHLDERVTASVKHLMLHIFPPTNSKFTPRYLKEAKKARRHIREAERPPLSAMVYDATLWEASRAKFPMIGNIIVKPLVLEPSQPRPPSTR